MEDRMLRFRVQNFGIFVVLFFSVGIIGGLSTSIAATTIEFNSDKTVVQEITVQGDVRLRHENFDNSGTTPDRQRQRIRLRVGVDVKLPNHLKVKTRFASGGTDQTTTNQSLDDNATPKAFSIDRAYLEWKPYAGLGFQGGKVKNPFWGPYSQDAMFDRDYNAEGISEHFEHHLGPVNIALTAGQFVMEEKSADLEDSYIFSEQITGAIDLPGESRFKAAVAHHEFTNVRQRNRGSNGSGGGDIGGVGTFGTNTSSAPFSILQLSGIFSSQIKGIPISIEGTYLKNMAAPKTTVGGALAQAEEQDTGIQVGVKWGQAKKKGGAQVAYFYKELDKDSAVAGITDSDFPNITNAKGHIAWISYALTDFVKATIKHFDAELKRVATGGADGSVNRTQFDILVKF